MAREGQIGRCLERLVRKPCEFETALLSASDWNASFIGAEESGGRPPRGKRPAQYFQRTFSVDQSPQLARVYATAHGVYELHLDGERLGDLELTPGFTAYRTHLEFQTYDVTDAADCGPAHIGGYRERRLVARCRRLHPSGSLLRDGARPARADGILKCRWQPRGDRDRFLVANFGGGADCGRRSHGG